MGKTLKDEGIKCHLLQENPSIVALIFVAISILVVDNNEPPGFVPHVTYLSLHVSHSLIYRVNFALLINLCRLLL